MGWGYEDLNDNKAISAPNWGLAGWLGLSLAKTLYMITGPVQSQVFLVRPGGNFLHRLTDNRRSGILSIQKIVHPKYHPSRKTSIQIINHLDKS